MLYIHELRHLSLKTADIESVYLVRELKEKTPYPFTEEKLSGCFADFLLSETDRQMMEQALALIPGTVEMVEQVLQEQSSLHEPMNLQRAITILNALPDALRQNLAYADEILAWQDAGISSLVPVMNKIPRARSPDDEKYWKQHINAFFEKVLRNDQFGFKYHDVLNEGPLAQISGLSESTGQGFFFHVTMEEELKKVNYETMKQRLPPEKVAVVEAIRENIELIRKGVERGYQGNMRMVNWALVMYAYVKWLSNKWEKFSY